MKKAGGLFFVLIAAFGLSGCATIVSGTNQKVSVTSQPSGAKVTADGKMSATTPTDFTLERKSDHTLEFSKEGYKSATVLLKRTMNGMGFGNALVGGIIGVGVDAVSGANNKLIPERVDVALETGTGFSESPRFIAQVDQDFYDKNILKPVQDRAKREDEKKLKETKKEEILSAETGPTTNFSPKTAVSPSPNV